MTPKAPRLLSDPPDNLGNRGTSANANHSRIPQRLAPLLLTVLLTACGIQPTGVFDGGIPPRVKVSGTALYFVRQGVLTPVTTPEFLRPEQALDELAKGSSIPDLASEVPLSIAPVRLTARGLTLANGAAGLSTVAIDQIVCTAGPENVVDGLGRRSCPVR